MPRRTDLPIRIALGLALAGLAGACARNPEPAAVPAQPQRQVGGGAPTDTAGGGGGGGRGGAPAQPRPYSRVITSEARTVVGLFKAHRIGDRLFFEIPRNELGKLPRDALMDLLKSARR